MRPDLIKASFTVLRKHKELILFPILSAIAALLVTATFAGFGGLVSVHLASRFRHFGGAVYPLLFAWYFLSAFGVVFFNCALAACAQECLSGGRPTVGLGVRRATGHAGAILVWAIVSSTAGIILQTIEELVPLAARVAVWLFGVAWGSIFSSKNEPGEPYRICGSPFFEC